MSDKTPASRQLLNITKALLDDANSEIERLRAALETIAKYADDPMDSACAQIAIRALKDK